MKPITAISGEMVTMVLRTLEFKDCPLDDPEFRQNLEEHEKELENTNREIKQLIKECIEVINASLVLSRCQKQLAQHLGQFNFETIGQSQTDDEMAICHSLKEFGRVLADIEEERNKIMDGAMDQFVKPLEDFRKEHIGNVKAEKKKFDKESLKFYQAQEKHLSLSSKKDENTLREADVDLQLHRRHFIEASLRYVKSIQEVHERKKFEFVETLWSFLDSWMRFFRLSYDITKDFEPYMKELQVRLQRTRDSFNAFCAETESLMNKIKTNSDLIRNRNADQTSGFLYLMEKKAFGNTWTKHFSIYDRESKKLTMVPFSHVHGKAIGTSETFMLKSCFRRPTESIDKRFCFDLFTEERSGPMTVQALSEDDRSRWMNAMDGKEPIYQLPGKPIKENEHSFELNATGFRFITSCIECIEKNGLGEQGLYRVAGVGSKVIRLLKAFFEENANGNNVIEQQEGDVRTLTSALKTFFRSLPEPLLTYRLHKPLITAAKKESKTERLNGIHSLVRSLPDVNFKMLEILTRHLARIAGNASKNLMTFSNLGVCFGPTLLRPEEESVAALVDIKFCNIIVELLIEHWQQIFLSSPANNVVKPIDISVPKRSMKDNYTNSVAAEYRHSYTEDGPPKKTEKLNVGSMNNLSRKNDFTNVAVFGQREESAKSASTVGSPSPSVSNGLRRESVYYSLPMESHASKISVVPDGNKSMINRGDPGRVAMAVARWVTPPAYPGTNPPRTPISAPPGTVSDSGSGISSSPSPYAASDIPFVDQVDKPADKEPSKRESVGGDNPWRRNPADDHNSKIAPVLSPRELTHHIRTTPMPSYSTGQWTGETGRNHPTSLVSNRISTFSPGQATLPAPAVAGGTVTRLDFPPKAAKGRYVGSKSGTVNIGALDLKSSGSSLSTFAARSVKIPVERPDVAVKRRVRTLYQCHADGLQELSFEPNEIITNVRPSQEPGWLFGQLRSASGLFPENYVEDVRDPP